jgi:hypothetical protein
MATAGRAILKDECDVTHRGQKVSILLNGIECPKSNLGKVSDGRFNHHSLGTCGMREDKCVSAPLSMWMG